MIFNLIYSYENTDWYKQTVVRSLLCNLEDDFSLFQLCRNGHKGILQETGDLVKTYRAIGDETKADKYQAHYNRVKTRPPLGRP